MPKKPGLSRYNVVVYYLCILFKKLRCYKTQVYCFCISLTCAILVWKAMTNEIMSHKVPLIVVHYSLLLTAWGLLFCLVPSAKHFWSYHKKGGFFYYCCCLLVSLSAALLTAHVHTAYSNTGAKVLDENEVYLKTPQGISSEVFHSLLTFVLALFMILRMDRCYSPRNAALYWSSATLTNELVFLFVLVLNGGPYTVRYSILIHAFYVVLALLALNYFIRVKRRIIPCRSCERKKKSKLDSGLTAFLVISVISILFRLLAAIFESPSFLQTYAKNFEPMLLHPSNLGMAWTIVSALSSIPWCAFGILYIRRLACRKSLDWALLYAGSVLQGTFAYLTFWGLLNVQPQYKILQSFAPVTVLMNLLPVIAAHAYLLRCIKGAPASLEGDCAYLMEISDSDSDMTDDEEEEENDCGADNDDVCYFDNEECDFEPERPTTRKRL